MPVPAPTIDSPKTDMQVLEDEQASEPTLEYPSGKLIITNDRKEYSDGDIQLKIPSLGIDTPVLSSVDYEVLKSGVGLYEYSQLPSETLNSNVSIAGHRDIYGSEFYSIDELGSGDKLELVYGGTTYTYLYKDTKIVEPDDWSPIYVKDFSCLTLTSCDPIGVSTKRIIVTAELDSVSYPSKTDNAPTQ